MAKVVFLDPTALSGERIAYVVIAARYRDKWVFCRHKCRQTWEIPGGHREEGETPEMAAYRELWEETGASQAVLQLVSAYQVDDGERCGMLYYGEIERMENLPQDYEIGEVCSLDTLPDMLTYPGIQPQLFEKVQAWYCRP